MSDQDTGTTENFLGTLVGEGKKYGSVEELAKGTVHANQFIDTLKAEKQQLEDRLNSVQSQEDQLNNIVNLLKPEEKPIIEEVISTEDVTPLNIESEPKPTVPDMEGEFNRQEFARLAVAKYGDAKQAGNKLQEYIGNDKSKHDMVMTIMRTDPSALVNILPEVKEQKLMNPTSGTAMTGQSTTQLPVTHTEAMKVFMEDKALYRSAPYQSKLKQAVHMAKQAGINFENT